MVLELKRGVVCILVKLNFGHVIVLFFIRNCKSSSCLRFLVLNLCRLIGLG